MFFDLPVTTKKALKEYTRFRKYLLKTGYDMLQFSIYCRIVRNYDDAQKHLKRIQGNLPPEGSVRLLIITEKQYAGMHILVGEKTASENLLEDKDVLVL